MRRHPPHGRDGGRAPLPAAAPLPYPLLVAAVLAVTTTLIRHAATLGGGAVVEHLPVALLDLAFALPVAAAAVWLAGVAAARVGGGAAIRAALVTLAFGALAVPLAVLQGLGHYALGPAGAGHQHGGAAAAAPPAPDLAALAAAGVPQALREQPLVLVLALLSVAVAGRLAARRRVVAAPHAAGAALPVPTPVSARRRRPGFAVLAAAAAVAVVTPLLPALPAQADPPPFLSGGCHNPATQRRTFTVSAINVDITLDRFGDHDPYGFMYVLAANEAAVRAQEAALQAAAQTTDPNGAKVSIGLAQDAIQPLVVRARLGECVVFDLHNKLTQPPRGGSGGGATPVIVQPGPAGAQVPAVSIDLQGVAYDALGGAGGEAVGDNQVSKMVPPGQAGQYRFYLDPLLGEGARIFRSGGDSTQLTAHGLFGAVIAEPAGARWYDPATGAERTNDNTWSNWEAMIQVPGQPSFREFGIMYHEVGDENFNVRRPQRETGQTGVGNDPDGNGSPVPMIDTGAPSATAGSGGGTRSYRPAGKAINYRSEPFWRRLQQLAHRGATLDDLEAAESLAYGSYAFGDPATPMPRSYAGEPVKTRLMNVTNQQLHVHHLHGGATRWRMNPEADNTDMFAGLKKVPLQNAQSIRLDSQAIGPLESYNLEHECGAGGCQRAAADFLYHCHIAHHYIAGMWGIWRVFDTKQPGVATLPGRADPPTAVNSAGLIGRTIEGRVVVPNGPTTGGQINIADLVEPQLPPQGVPFHDTDATVWDWQRTGPTGAPVYVGEPEDTTVWPGYTSPAPGQRPQIMFNPTNGRPAWPLLRPHLGKRPPFAPGQHSGAPYLGNTASAQRPDGLCPASSAVREYDITAIGLPIQETVRERDEEGMVFILNEDKDQVLEDANNGTEYPEPLAIRSNVGDCVAITLASNLPEEQQSKVNMHIHFVQFDPQASDGVITGFAYEQSVYPTSREDRSLTSVVDSDTIAVSQVTDLRVGIAIGIGVGTPEFEIRTITGISGNQLTFDQPLTPGHAAGEPVSVEFVQYRWYSDVDSGTVFWHDHVNGIQSWAHGLFGAHIIEPAGSTYHDPVTGAPVRRGTIVDIRSTGSVAVGHSGSFREFVVFLHNGRRGRSELTADNSNLGLSSGQECEEGSINLRAAPLGERTPPGATPADPDTTMQRREFNGARCRNAFRNVTTDPSDMNTDTINATVTTVDPYAFSSVKYGDPMTPLMRAYAGDPVMVRTVGVNERVEALRIQGHRFRTERFNADGQLIDTQTTGISERFDYFLDGGAGGPARMAGDYLYHSGRTFAFESGAWGIFRVHDRRQPDLQPLPGRPAPPTGAGFPRLVAATGDTQANPGPNPASAFNANGSVNTSVVTSAASPCPSGAPVRAYDVTVFDQELPTAPFPDSNGVIYALTSDVAAIRAGTKPVQPLVLRANRNDCLQITLRNDIDPDSLYGGTRAGFDLSKLLRNPQLAAGSAVGLNPDTTVGIGDSVTYRFRADRELGTTIFRNLGSIASQRHGAYGLVIVEPQNSTWSDSFTNSPLGPTATSSQAIIRAPGGVAFREFALTFQTTDQHFARSVVPYTDVIAGSGINSTNNANNNPPPFDQGFTHVSYTSEPLTERLGLTNNPSDPMANPNPDADYGMAFSSVVHGDPATPTFRAYAGDDVVFRMAVPVSEQYHTFSVAGHMFPLEPFMWDGDDDLRSHLLTSRAVTGGQTLDAELVGGAGGRPAHPGDYMYRDGRQPFVEAGMWGIFRVHRIEAQPRSDLAPLGPWPPS